MAEDCTEILEQLYIYVDNEMPDEARQHVETHLRACVACLEAFDFEAQVKTLIARRGRERCPDEVRERLTATVRTYLVDQPPTE
ncbi:MAG: mycothiol system anti-sigma-R factor [Microthrixaceae bacterium]